MPPRRSFLQLLSAIPFLGLVSKVEAKEFPVEEMPHPAVDREFNNFASMKAESERFAKEGWNVLVCDEPRLGLLGYSVFRMIVAKDGQFVRTFDWDSGNSAQPHPATRNPPDGVVQEEAFMLTFMPFGSRVENLVSPKTDDEIQAALHAFEGHEFYPCNDPKTCLLGFVHFDEPGVANVLQIRLTAVIRGPRPGFTFRGELFTDYLKSTFPPATAPGFNPMRARFELTDPLMGSSLVTMPQLSSNPPPPMGSGTEYLITRPGKAPRAFLASKDAVEFLVEHPGPAKLFGPDWNLILTKGMMYQD